MKYICEDCSKVFDTEKDALDCEKVHKEEKVKQARLAEQKQAKINAINADFEKLLTNIREFENDYGIVKFNSENRRSFDKLFDTLFWF